MLYIFGQMSLIGLPANVLVVTLVPLAMLLGLAAGLAGMLGLYGLVILVTYVLWHKTRLLKPDNSTDKGELYDEPLSAIH